MKIGVDMIEISRMEKAASVHFVKRVFSMSEQDYFKSKRNPYPSMAANFAAKEAFAKALGTGVRGFSLAEVSVLRDSLGAPYYEFSGKAKQIVQAKNLVFSLSLSHTNQLAIAFTTAQKKQKFL